MANWCSNWVTLHGDPKNVEAFMNENKVLKNNKA
jgi:hypothetical protein